MKTLALDIYGTLINTQGIHSALAEALADPDQAERISRRWREKQLEYSFRRALMERYQPFSTCTRQALRFALEEAGVQLSEDTIGALLKAYEQLPAFPDAQAMVTTLADQPVRLFAFSNGEARVVSGLLERAGLLDKLEGIVSVELVRTFKPSARVYQHFLDITDSSPDQTWLVSGNPFDVLGAQAQGWRTVWVRRQATVFDPWDTGPDETIASLHELGDLLV